MIDLTPLHRAIEPQLRAAIDAKAKPLGALGRIEEIAVQIGLVKQSLKPKLGRAAVIVFAGDHGLVAEGVTAYPSDVSAIVAQMVLSGVAGANIAARAVGADVFLVNAGLATAIAPCAGKAANRAILIERRIRSGTSNSLLEPAMTVDEAPQAMTAGAEMASHVISQGYGILALGEIGIGNSSAAALVAHAVTGLPLETLTGPGAGIPPGGLSHKLDVLCRAYARAPVRDGSDALREFGGFEMAMLAGAMIGAARAGGIVLVDGFIATACAAAAVAMQPNLRDYLIFAHISPERGHAALLDWLNTKPLLNLDLRLGEGTGAALAIPLVRMAEALLCDMADLP